MFGKKKIKCPYIKGCSATDSRGLLSPCESESYLSCVTYITKKSEEEQKYQPKGGLEERARE